MEAIAETPRNPESDPARAPNLVLIGIPSGESIAPIVNRLQMGLEEVEKKMENKVELKLGIGTSVGPVDVSSHFRSGLSDVDIVITRADPRHPKNKITHPIKLTNVSVADIDVNNPPTRYIIENCQTIVICYRHDEKADSGRILEEKLKEIRSLNPHAPIYLMNDPSEKPTDPGDWRRPSWDELSRFDGHNGVMTCTIFPDRVEPAVEPLLKLMNQQLKPKGVWWHVFNPSYPLPDRRSGDEVLAAHEQSARKRNQPAAFDRAQEAAAAKRR